MSDSDLQLRPGWCHCMAGTYGSWLPGDPRGFRTRGHREHVEGDYKSPPTKDYSERLAAARWVSDEPVTLSIEARRAACDAVVHALVAVHQLELLAVAICAQHLHLLARISDGEKPTPLRRRLRETDPVRFYVGIAKERSAKHLLAAGLVQRGKVWARRGKIVRIHDRSHQLNVFRYITEHRRQGGAVWTFREPLPDIQPDKKPTP